MTNTRTRQAYAKLPIFGHGQRIGLFGGSFDPAHEGHRHVALTAIECLQLDWLWVLPSPGNPLKEAPVLSSSQRKRRLESLMRHPKIVLTDIEEKIDARFTLQTIRFLRLRAPAARFVWVMGADNLESFHRWQGWKTIAKLLPVAVIDRDEGRFSALNSKAAQCFSGFRVGSEHAARLPFLAPPAWAFLHGPRVMLSSSALRRSENH